MKIQYIHILSLILVLVLFLLPFIAVAGSAVKFVILELSDGTVGTPITVIIEAQDSDDQVDASCQNDVTLVTDGSATGAGLVDIVNGLGTIEINDEVAETVTLSLADTEATGLDVSSTQEVDFAAASDTTAPSAISDLAASNPTASSITLAWTAPGDDENTGTATTYDVRYSTANINNENKWDSATPATGEPSPSVAGSSESMTISDLEAGTEYFFVIKTSDEVPNESDLSNVASETTTASSDTTAPSAISDLAASNPTASSITLAWTAPGDDDNTGTATTYDVRYSTANINNENKWDSATPATGEPSPSVAGSSESMTISDLEAGTEYFFAIKTSDEVPNESDLSNVASETTAGASTGKSADLSITKSDSPDPVIAGNTLTYTITITNNGPDNAKNVVVSDTLPLALTSPSLTPSQGTCAFFPCNLGTIPKNLSASITITSPIDPSTTGIITNIASVSSDTDDPVASNNVAIQETVASLPPPPPPPPSLPSPPPLQPTLPPPLSVETLVKPTTVSFSGRAFPDAKIFVVDKDIRFETIVNQDIVADENGAFQINFVGISQGLHSFGLLIKDKDNRITQTKFFNIDLLANDLVVKDILAPPTAGLSQRLVSRGRPAMVLGNASPNNSVILEVDDIIKKEAKVEKDGSYKVAVDTGILEFGTHRVRVKQIDASQKRESDYSLTNAFTVSHLILPKTDLSGDGVVNIKDWSMFLSSWVSKSESQKKIIDLNDDGKINISDFSIFIRTIKK